MIEQDFAEFKEIMGRAALLTYTQKNKDWADLLTAMFEELICYPLEAVRGAVSAHVRAAKFFPALADIVTRIEGTGDDRSALAWRIVVKAVERNGQYDSIRFPSPAYHYAIANMGGWVSLCKNLTEDNEPFRGKEFMRFFKLGEQHADWEIREGKVRVPMYLAGLCETQNRGRGIALPAKVYDAGTGELAELPELSEHVEIMPLISELMGGMAVREAT